MFFCPYRPLLLPYADVFLIAYQKFSARFPEAKNNIADLKNDIFQIKKAKKKAYLSLNKFIFEPELNSLREFLKIILPLIDGVVVNDFGLLLLLKELEFNREIILNTDTTITNHFEAEILLNLGFSKIVTARELTLVEIKEMSSKLPDNLIVPIFGHQLIATSRRPLLEAYGACIKKNFEKEKIYFLQEEKREDYFLAYEDQAGFHIFDAKALNGISHLLELQKFGCSNFWFDFFAISDDLAIWILQEAFRVLKRQKNSICPFKYDFTEALWFTDTSESKAEDKTLIKEATQLRLKEFFATKGSTYTDFNNTNINQQYNSSKITNNSSQLNISSKDIRMELLAPAGNLEKLKTAVLYGADAVFVGGKVFSLRSRASNFDYKSLKEGVDFAHQYGSRVHVTVNMIPHEYDLEGIKEYLIALKEIGVDAIIVASLFILNLAREIIPEVEIHISTQYSITHHYTINFYKNLGAARVVLAREHTLEELTSLQKESLLPLEVFIHGGMCVHFSGRCTLSNYMTYRDANRGGCAQSCRWRYKVFECKYDSQKSSSLNEVIFNNSLISEKIGSLISHEEVLFTMSSKDLNAMEILPSLNKIQVASLKIEGRMKTEYYIATVVSAYRRAIDELNKLCNDRNISLAKRLILEEEIINRGKKELMPAANRETFSGFYLRIPHAEGHLYKSSIVQSNQSFVGQVLAYDLNSQKALVQVRNPFSVGDTLEILEPKSELKKFVVKNLINQDGEITDRVYKAMEEITLTIPYAVSVGAYLRLVR